MKTYSLALYDPRGKGDAAAASALLATKMNGTIDLNGNIIVRFVGGKDALRSTLSSTIKDIGEDIMSLGFGTSTGIRFNRK